MHFACASCLETLTLAVSLPCGASVCKSCVRICTNDLFDAVCAHELRFNQNTAASLSRVLTRFRCPVRSCRQWHYGLTGVDWVLEGLLQICLASASESDAKGSRDIGSAERGKGGAEKALSKAGSHTSQSHLLELSLLALKKGHFELAAAHADEAHALNPWNRRGIAKRRIIEMRSGFAIETKQLALPSIPTHWTPNAQQCNAIKVPDVPSAEMLELLECILCLTTFNDPLTLTCGHSACRNCLLACLVHAPLNPVCPVCRFPLPSFAALTSRKTNWFINALTTKWAHVLPTRPSIEWNLPSAQRMTIPIFPVSLAFPGTRQEFHMFEPRYRVMVKECLETGSPFGLCLPKRSFNPFEPQLRFSKIGSAVSIEFSEEMMGDERETSKGSLPRYYIQTKAQFRFKVVDDTSTISPEGLHYAHVERLDDVDFNDMHAHKRDASSNDNVTTTTTTTASEPSATIAAHEFDPLEYATMIMKLRRTVTGMLEGLDPARVRLLEEGYGPMPSDAGMLSFWAAQWIPLNLQRKYEILSSVYPHERMRTVIEALRL
ncbi:hypothetical protein CcCBS67573_g05544 [Chytriomyces confervae]|uniref:Uncharacterized protein n=1 Tax=Chytriomyces confervae TaxID=246404 RepID=A0A507FC80_9FUNG|nr:hypothetical protein CcCBS67573_g05544 [Chytriomyces confervae]